MPPNGLTSAVQALRYYERRQEVVANNLANVSSDGFRAERVFGRLLQEANGSSSVVAAAATDLRPGTLRESGRPLDVAIEREGFLVVATPNGERLTRGGSLQLDAENRLVDANGFQLLGEGGPITLTATQAAKAGAGGLQLSSAGELRVGTETVDVLRVEREPAGVSLQREAGGLLVPTASRAELPREARTLRQGFLEGSNVDSLGALVDMIAVQRAFASVQKAVTVLDEVRDTAANQIGKPV